MNREQTLVALAAIPVLALTLGALWAVENHWLNAPSGWDRLHIAAAAGLALGACLLFSIWRIALFRFFSERDRPAALAEGQPGRALKVHLALLQNTLEQTVLAAIAYGAFAAVAPLALAPLLLAYGGFFVVGRVAFALGYRCGAPGRAFGFGLTVAPTATLYVLLAGLVLA